MNQPAAPDECVHEILRASCAWCAPRPGAPPQTVEVEHRFIAQWSGRCAGECGEWFRAGEEIGVVDGEYFCGRCSQ